MDMAKIVDVIVKILAIIAVSISIVCGILSIYVLVCKPLTQAEYYEALAITGISFAIALYILVTEFSAHKLVLKRKDKSKNPSF